jgi:threonine dehydrogenase-like Zn-dependent dehydrogenase
LNVAEVSSLHGRMTIISTVTDPHDDAAPDTQPTFFANIAIAGGPAPVRAYIGELLPDILTGCIQPGRVFDRVTKRDGVPDGYRAMNDRDAIEVLIEF